MKILLETLYLSIKRLKARNNKGGHLNCPYSVPKFFDFMTTRRRTSATKTAKIAPVKESITKVEKVTPTRAKRVRKVTPVAKSIVTEVKESPKSSPDFTQLRGFDFVVLPLIYLETFVVNILQNLSLNVPERVAIK